MKRRTLLSALGASVVSLAGCHGQTTSNPESTDTQTPQGAPRQVRVTSVDSVPDDTPFDHSIDVVRSGITADQTAQIRTSLLNTTDTSVWNTTRIPTFSDFITQAGTQGQQLLLLQPGEQYETVRQDCWRADLSTAELNHAYTDVVAPIQYEAGESRSTTFDIYGHPGNTGPCLAPDDYPVESLYEVSDDSDTDTADWKYRWGFSITVEEP